MTAKEYQRLRAQIEDQYRRDMEALDRVWKLSGGGAMPTAETPETPGASVVRYDNGRVERLVRAVVQELGGDEFTIHHVREFINDQRPEYADVPRASISTALRRLAGDGKLILVEQGVGKRPSRYRVNAKSEIEPAEEEVLF